MILNKKQLEQLKQYILLYLLHNESYRTFETIIGIEIINVELICGYAFGTYNNYLSLEFQIISDEVYLSNNRTLMIPQKELDIIYNKTHIKCIQKGSI